MGEGLVCVTQESARDFGVEEALHKKAQWGVPRALRECNPRKFHNRQPKSERHPWPPDLSCTGPSQGRPKPNWPQGPRTPTPLSHPANGPAVY
jgi:hypothetical protein